MFYILTCGSTASVWLSRVLSYHPEIVCFHGVKSISAVAERDTSAPLAREFVRELAHLYALSQGEQVFGSVHGFAAAEIAPEIAAVEGAFAAMIRHPVTRINSLFHRAADTVGTIDLPDDDIYRPFRDNQEPPSDIDNIDAQSPFGAHARLFRELASNTLTEDTFILRHMEEQDIFQYERIVLEPEYFRACFERLAEGCRHAMAISPGRRGSTAARIISTACSRWATSIRRPTATPRPRWSLRRGPICSRRFSSGNSSARAGKTLRIGMPGLATDCPRPSVHSPAESRFLLPRQPRQRAQRRPLCRQPTGRDQPTGARAAGCSTYLAYSRRNGLLMPIN